MSVDIDSKMIDHTLVKFWGGDGKGFCLQITASEMNVRDTVSEMLQEESFIQLTMEEANALRNALGVFIHEEAKRRQALLRRDLEKLKLAEKLVFNEIATLPDEFFDTFEMATSLVAAYCPKF
jgi:hypothetical protein